MPKHPLPPEPAPAPADAPDKNTAHWLQQRLADLLVVLRAMLTGGERPRVAPFPPPNAYFQFRPGVPTPGGRTENYMFMGWVGAWIWYALWGTPEEAAYWRALLIQYLRRQRLEGHMRGEQCCPDPHHGMHLAAALLARVAALALKDAEMRDVTGSWTSDHYAIGASVIDEHGIPRSPGARNKFRPPTQQLWGYFMNAVRHRPQQDHAGGDRYWTAAHACDVLQAAGDVHLGIDVGAAPRLMTAMRVTHTPEGFVAKLDGSPGRMIQVVSWVRVIFGQPAEYGWGNAPAPDPEGHATDSAYFPAAMPGQRGGVLEVDDSRDDEEG